MKTKRTVDEKLAGTKEVVSINGKPHSPKRLKVFEVQKLLNEKAEKIKAVQVMQRKALEIYKAVESGEVNKMDYTSEESQAYLMEAQNTSIDLQVELGGDHNLWLLERMYPEAKESGDLEQIDFDEYDAALEAMFEVNPSLGKSKALLLMNPLNQAG